MLRPALRCAVVAAIVAACGGDPPGVEAQIRRDLARQLGVEVASVRCPDGPYPKACTADAAGTPLAIVAIEVEGRDVAWRLDGLVIATAPLEARLAGELADLGIDGAADCGPVYRVVRAGDVVRCTLDVPGGPGLALVTIVDDQLALTIELALDPAAAAARTEEVDDAELERRSRALDTDDALAGGEDDE